MPLIAYVAQTMSADRMKVVDQANTIIDEYRDQGFNLTLRQLYYQFVARDLIPNNLKSYKRLGDIIADARLQGLIDWDDISDRLREIRRLAQWEHPSDILEASANQFRIDLWEGQPYRVEVWVEKDALAEVVERAAFKWRCPVMVCRGYMSASAVWEAGHGRFKDWIGQGQKPVVIHLGDHDPSGIDMTRDIADRLSMFAEEEVHVERIALNMDQVEKYNPPANPAKLSDSRAAGYVSEYGDDSWELDALEPKLLDELIQDGIMGYLRKRPLFEKRRKLEDQHKSALSRIAKHFDRIAEDLPGDDE